MARNLVLATALIAGVSFYLVPRMPGVVWWVAWKGAGVALLALWAAMQARDRNGGLLVGVLAFGAVGDVLLETSGMAVGGAAFLIGHLLAIALYQANRRGPPTRAVAAAIFAGIAVSGAAFRVSHDHGVALYALGLGAMTGSALASRFPLAAIGAVLFVLSDLLIFARHGVLNEASWPALLIWPAYFAGQTLVAVGVVRGLRTRDAAPI